MVHAIREQCKTMCAVLTGVLIMISEPVHILVPPLAIADAAGEWT
jgi:hypothetical protein